MESQELFPRNLVHRIALWAGAGLSHLSCFLQHGPGSQTMVKGFQVSEVFTLYFSLKSNLVSSWEWQNFALLRTAVTVLSSACSGVLQGSSVRAPSLRGDCKEIWHSSLEYNLIKPPCNGFAWFFQKAEFGSPIPRGKHWLAVIKFTVRRMI